MQNYLFTSESVTEGHPDKVCDIISDAILDEILKQDKDSRVACETMITTAQVIVSAEITTKASIDYHKIINETLEQIGYSPEDLGETKLDDFGKKKVLINTLIKQQSPHIAQGVDSSADHEQGAGDQGIMFGYACKETPELMPMPIQLSHRLAKKLTDVRKNGKLNWLKPDGKTQVTVEYDKNNNPVRIAKVVLATQHLDMLDRFDNESKEHDFISSELTKKVILPILNNANIDYDKNFIINGTGRFVEGGPIADVGLTGRKIIVDTYGGYARHGGGAFSGKDPTKVDRSAAYAARYVAKSIVKAKLAKKAEVQLSYAIGVAKPISILVETFDTGVISQANLTELIKEHFDLRPAAIIKEFNLRNLPKKMGGKFFRKTASYGHFGRRDLELPWENVEEKAAQLAEASKIFL